MSKKSDTGDLGASGIQVRSGAAMAAALKLIRGTRGMSQADMGERLGCSRQTILNLESGTSKQLDRLVRFVRFSGFDLVLVPRQVAAESSTK